MFLSKTISTYLVKAVLPYFGMAWLILTVVLFVQQAGRYAEIYFNPNLPSTFGWKLTIALIPNVIAFTCPMAVLVGVIIGLSRMQTDNELIAIRSAGVGNLAAIIPIFLFGVVLSLFSLIVNIYGVPIASSAVRSIATQTALYKLESPIEPGVFNTEIAGFTIYVDGVSIEDGEWSNVFVYNEDRSNGTTRLITSPSGRIDSQGQNSELVLENAVVSTFVRDGSTGNLVAERLGEFRVAIKTKRDEMMARLNSVEPAAEELGFPQLLRYISTHSGKEKIEAQILIVRRIGVAISPMIFCVLGASMVLRFNRRGHGFGIALALGTLLGYFLLTFAGEQLARTGAVPVVVGGLIPILSAIAAIVFFSYSGSLPAIRESLKKLTSSVSGYFEHKGPKRRDILVDLTTGIRDFELILSVLKYYLIAMGFLGSIFVVFTAFELWRHAGLLENGVWLLAMHLLYLLPFVYIQLAPTAAMIAMLTTFTIKSRQNEVITWLSAGQSIYRLIFPCFLLMLFLGAVNFAIQETVMPITNRVQEAFRYQIRNGGKSIDSTARYWQANETSIIAYEFDPAASDNVVGQLPACIRNCNLRNVMIFEFGENKAELRSVYRIPDVVWENGVFRSTGDVEKYSLGESGFARTEMGNGTFAYSWTSPIGSVLKPNHMTASDLRLRIADAESDGEIRRLSVALERKYSTLILPFVIALFTAPFALGLERKQRVVSVAYGVGLWLVFMVVSSAFEQMGLNGTLPAELAVWAPIAIFTLFGIYLLAKAKT